METNDLIMALGMMVFFGFIAWLNWRDSNK